MGEDLIEKAFFGVAGFDDLAVIAAVHGGVVGGEIEAGFVFVRVVAVEAAFLEEGADGFLVGYGGGEGEGEEKKQNPKPQIRNPGENSKFEIRNSK
jgi:hypothetical protein